VLFQSQTVFLHEFDELSNLLRLSLSLVVLKIERLGNTWPRKMVMTTAGARMMKAEGFDEPHEIREAHIARATEDEIEGFARVHGGGKPAAPVPSKKLNLAGGGTPGRQPR